MASITPDKRILSAINLKFEKLDSKKGPLI